MNISFSTDETLAALAQMPFLDSIELAAVTGLPERTAREVAKYHPGEEASRGHTLLPK